MASSILLNRLEIVVMILFVLTTYFSVINTDNSITTPVYAQQEKLDFGRTINLSNNIGKSYSADMVTQGDIVYIVWRDGSSGKDDVYFTKSVNNAATFQSPVSLTKLAGVTYSPKLAVSGNSVYVVWSDNSIGNNEIFLKVSTDNGNTFGDSINISNTPQGDSTDPQISVSGNNVYVIWKDNASGDTKVYFRSSNDGAKTFNNIKSSFLNGDHDVQLASHGDNVYAIWQEMLRSKSVIYFTKSIDAGNTFSSTHQVISERSFTPLNEYGLSVNPKMIVNENNLYVVWTRSDSQGLSPDIYFTKSTNAGNTFRDPVQLSKTIGLSTDPKIAISGNNIYVVWNEGATSASPGQAFFSASANDGSTFHNSTTIAKNITAFYPQVAAYANNVYAVMWYINPTFGTPDIVIAKSSDNGASFDIDTLNLSSNRGASINPQISVDDKGYVSVLWEDTSPGNYDLLVRSTNTAVWSSPVDLGSFVTNDPASAENYDGRLQVFTQNGVHHLSTRWQGAPNDGWSNDWLDLGGYLASNIAVGHNADGRLQVFAKGFLNWSNGSQLYNGLISITQSTPGSNTWDNWISLGGYLTSDPVVASNADGRIQVFARGASNELKTNWQTSPNNDQWYGWVNPPGLPSGGYLTSAPAVGKNSDGRLLVSAIGKNNDMLYIIQSAPNSVSWSNWQNLGGYCIGKPTIISNADGRLEIFVRGGYFDIWHKWQTQILPNGEIIWSNWKSLNPFYTSNIVVSKNFDGRLEAFAKDGHNSLHSMHQLAANIDQ